MGVPLPIFGTNIRQQVSPQVRPMIVPLDGGTSVAPPAITVASVAGLVVNLTNTGGAFASLSSTNGSQTGALQWTFTTGGVYVITATNAGGSSTAYAFAGETIGLDAELPSYTDVAHTTPAGIGDTVRSALLTDGTYATFSVSGITLEIDDEGNKYFDGASGTGYISLTMPTMNTGTVTLYSKTLFYSKTATQTIWNLGSIDLIVFQSLGGMSVYTGSVLGPVYTPRQREFPTALAAVCGGGSILLRTPDASTVMGATSPANVTACDILSNSGTNKAKARLYKAYAFAAAHGTTMVGVGLTALSGQPVYPTNKPLILVEGDSRSYGVNATLTQYDYPTRLLSSLTSAAVSVCNYAVSGTVASELDDRAAAVDALYDASRSDNVLVVWNGVNSNWTDYTTYRGYIQDRIATGWAVIVCTDLFAVGRTSASRTAYNASILANTGDGYTVADLAANATIGTDAAASDPTYFPDGVHPSDACFAIIEPIIKAAVDAVL